MTRKTLTFTLHLTAALRYNEMNNEKSVAKYALVEFIEERTDDGKISIECVPSSWVKFDQKIGKCSVKFLAQPYGPEDIRLINDFIKKCAPAPQSWPRFPIILKGDAATYSEACKKIKVLETQAFTTDSETRGTEKCRNITQKFKDKSERDLLNTSSSSSCNSDSSISHKNRRGKKKRFEVMSQHHPKDRNNNCGVTSDSKPKSAINSSSNSEDSAGVGNVSNLSHRNIVISRNPNITDKSDQNRIINREKIGVDAPAGSIINAKKSISTNNFTSIDNPEMPDVTHMDRDLVCLYVAIKKLSVQVATMDQNQQLMINALERSQLTSNSKISTSTFFTKHNFVRIKTVDEFKILESNLDEDPEFLNDYKDALECQVMRTYKETIVAVVKAIFDRVFAMKCTAMKQSREKFVLKGSRFYNLLYELILRSHTNDGGAITERIFYSALSRCLTDSKDWDGNR
ncbi:hypothetical protein PV326_010303, partial [Microctonus aethiopoides]